MDAAMKTARVLAALLSEADYEVLDVKDRALLVESPSGCRVMIGIQEPPQCSQDSFGRTSVKGGLV